MMESIDFLNAGGSLASVAGLSLSIAQWLKSTGADESRQTVDDYLEWLRRENHAELLAAIRGHAGALAAVREIIGNLRDAIVRAIEAHERASQDRHRELLNARVPSPPILQISFKRRFDKDWVQHPSLAYKAVLWIVNTGGQNATVESCAAELVACDGRKIQATHVYLPEGFLNIAANGGAEAAYLLTGPQRRDERPGEIPEFQWLDIRLAQEQRRRRFIPADGDALKELQETAKLLESESPLT